MFDAAYNLETFFFFFKKGKVGNVLHRGGEVRHRYIFPVRYITLTQRKLCFFL